MSKKLSFSVIWKVQFIGWKVQFICWRVQLKSSVYLLKVEHFQLVEKFSFVKFVRILPYEKYKFPKSSGSVFQFTQLFSGSVFSFCSTFQLLFIERKWLKTHLSQGFDSLFEEVLLVCFRMSFGVLLYSLLCLLLLCILCIVYLFVY